MKGKNEKRKRTVCLMSSYDLKFYLAFAGNTSAEGWYLVWYALCTVDVDSSFGKPVGSCSLATLLTTVITWIGTEGITNFSCSSQLSMKFE